MRLEIMSARLRAQLGTRPLNRIRIHLSPDVNTNVISNKEKWLEGQDLGAGITFITIYLSTSLRLTRRQPRQHRTNIHLIAPQVLRHFAYRVAIFPHQQCHASVAMQRSGVPLTLCRRSSYTFSISLREIERHSGLLRYIQQVIHHRFQQRYSVSSSNRFEGNNRVGLLYLDYLV